MNSSKYYFAYRKKKQIKNHQKILNFEKSPHYANSQLLKFHIKSQHGLSPEIGNLLKKNFELNTNFIPHSHAALKVQL